MARVNKSLLGMMTGKIGSVVIYPMFGKLYARSVPVNRPNRIKSPAQQAQNQKIKLLGSFLNLCTDFIKIGYKIKSIEMQKTTYNLSQSYHLKQGIKGSLTAMEIDWEMIRLSVGNLAAPDNFRVFLENNQIILNWDIPAKISADEGAQQTMVLLYCEGTKRVYTEFFKADKKNGRQILRINTNAGAVYHLYFCFKNLLTDEVSTSIYGGCLRPFSEPEIDAISGVAPEIAV